MNGCWLDRGADVKMWNAEEDEVRKVGKLQKRWVIIWGQATRKGSTRAAGIRVAWHQKADQIILEITATRHLRNQHL